MHQGDRRTRDGKPIGASGRPVTAPGYSGRPQAVKLGLKPGQRVSLHQPPDGWALTDPPDGLPVYHIFHARSPCVVSPRRTVQMQRGLAS